MEWWGFAWAILVCMFVVGGPGLFVAVTLRLTGLWLAAAAPAIGVSLVVVSSIVARWLSIPWSIGSVIVMGLAAGIPAFFVTRYVPALRPRPETRQLVPALAVTLGAVLLAGRLTVAIRSPELFAQVGDNVFHLNAVQFIVDGWSASPFGFGRFNEPTAGVSFYPSAWHAITALVVELSGATVPAASNAMLFVVSCLVWPLGAVLLTRTLFGTDTSLLIAAGALTAGLAGFPLQLVPYMGTYPLLGSIPLVPIALAAILEVCRVGNLGLGVGPGALVMALSLPGIAAMHPSALIMLAVLALPVLAAVAIRVARVRPHLRRLAALLLALAIVTVLALVVLVRRTTVQDDAWRGTFAQSIGEVIMQSLAGYPISLVVATLTIIGVVMGLIRGGAAGRTAVAMWALVAFIYVAAAADDEFLRMLIAGPWYSDATRVSSFAPVVVLPLAALGTQASWRWILRATKGMPLSHNRATAIVATSAAVAFFCALLVYSPAVRQVDLWTRSVFDPTDDPFVSRVGLGTDERAVLKKVDEIVPQGDLIAGNPRDGSSFAYALTGRPVLLAHLLAPITPLKQTFLDGFATAGNADPGCEATKELGVKWILEFHPDKLFLTTPRYPGLQELDRSPNTELVFRQGTSSLYKVIGCGIR